ncbi:ATP cone domain-containing protein [Microaceticoccus formicicus]|uniref:ATP cone domain-containing protein n=1 Tax=Microaceticoccus formicicus TaxID=3118105 RepID=UPI003CD00DB1|nr:ATP cone domain-containing protein [Peptoniphilaceae bacterium AMB_02]
MKDEKINIMVDEIAKYILDNKYSNIELTSFLDQLKLEILNRVFIGNDEVLVMKRRGGIEPFDLEKLKKNIAGSSDDVKQSLSEGELNMIAKHVKSKIKGLNYRVISSKDIIGITKAALEELDYDGVLVGYSAFNK